MNAPRRFARSSDQLQPPQLVYREESASSVQGMDPYLEHFWKRHPAPARRCGLFDAEESEPLTSIWIIEYPARIGCASVQTVGLSAGATHPNHRRSGLFTRLMKEVMARSRHVAPLACLKGIDGFYARLGFVPFLPECKFSLSASALSRFQPAKTDSIETWRAEFTADACTLYNQQHARRSGTVERDPARFVGPRPTSTWIPGDEGAVCLRQGKLVGYVFTAYLPFGQTWRPFEVTEIVAADACAASTMLDHVRQLAAQQARNHIEIHEPDDSVVGTLLRRVSCEYTLQYSADGGWMAAVLDRERLIDDISPELARRFGLQNNYVATALRNGALLPTDAALLEALLTARGWSDAENIFSSKDRGTLWPAFREQCVSGIGERTPAPFIHTSDRY
jgi:GNAT superfamily N-acetyltransferase